MRRSRRAVRNVGIDVLCRFPRTVRSVGQSHRSALPISRHFHRGRCGDFRFAIWPVDATRVLLVSAFLAVGLDLWFVF